MPRFKVVPLLHPADYVWRAGCLVLNRYWLPEAQAWGLLVEHPVASSWPEALAWSALNEDSIWLEKWLLTR